MQFLAFKLPYKIIVVMAGQISFDDDIDQFVLNESAFKYVVPSGCVTMAIKLPTFQRASRHGLTQNWQHLNLQFRNMYKCFHLNVLQILHYPN